LGIVGIAVGVVDGSGGTVTLSGKVSGAVSGKDVLSGVVACWVGTTQTGVLIEVEDGVDVDDDAGTAGAAGDRGAPKVMAG
jgi:hypothetical protein